MGFGGGNALRTDQCEATEQPRPGTGDLILGHEQEAIRCELRVKNKAR